MDAATRRPSRPSDSPKRAPARLHGWHGGPARSMSALGTLELASSLTTVAGPTFRVYVSTAAGLESRPLTANPRARNPSDSPPAPEKRSTACKPISPGGRRTAFRGPTYARLFVPGGSTALTREVCL